MGTKFPGEEFLSGKLHYDEFTFVITKASELARYETIDDEIIITNTSFGKYSIRISESNIGCNAEIYFEYEKLMNDFELIISFIMSRFVHVTKISTLVFEYKNPIGSFISIDAKRALKRNLNNALNALLLDSDEMEIDIILSTLREVNKLKQNKTKENIMANKQQDQSNKITINIENYNDKSEIEAGFRVFATEDSSPNSYFYYKNKEDNEWYLKLHFENNVHNEMFDKLLLVIFEESFPAWTKSKHSDKKGFSISTIFESGNPDKHVIAFVDAFIKQVIVVINRSKLLDLSTKHHQIKFFFSKMDGRYIQASQHINKGKYGKFAIDFAPVNPFGVLGLKEDEVDYLCRVCFEDDTLFINFEDTMEYILLKAGYEDCLANTTTCTFGTVYTVKFKDDQNLKSFHESMVTALKEFSKSDPAKLVETETIKRKQHLMTILAQSDNVNCPYPPTKLQVYPKQQGVRIIYAIMFDLEYSKSHVVTTLHTFKNGSTLGVDESTFGVLRFVISTPDKYINQAPFVEFLSRMHLVDELKDHDVLYTNKINGVYAKEFMLKLTPFCTQEQDESKIFFDNKSIQTFELMLKTIMEEHFEKYEPKTIVK